MAANLHIVTPLRAITAMILYPRARPLPPSRSSRPSPHFVTSQPSLLHDTTSVVRFPPSTHSSPQCRNSNALVVHYQHHSKGLGKLGGLRNDLSKKGRKRIFGLKAVRVHEEGYTRKTKKKGLQFWFDSNGLGGGVGKCYSTLKEEDSFTKDQHQQARSNSTSSSSSEVIVSNVEENTENRMKGKSLWSKLGQNFNLSGVSFSARVIVKDRHLAIPHVSVPDISWIDWKALRARGFDGVLFDKDNTLTAPYGQNIWPPLTDSVEECREAFGGRMALLSNSAGLYQYDPLGAEAKILEKRLGIPVIRHGQKKPAGNALALSNYFGCDPAMLIMVGDRFFTDVVFGNNNGLLTIRPAPLTTRGDPFMVKRVRVLEETLVDWWRRQGCLPPNHQLCDNPVDFIKDPGCWNKLVPSIGGFVPILWKSFIVWFSARIITFQSFVAPVMANDIAAN